MRRTHGLPRPRPEPPAARRRDLPTPTPNVPLLAARGRVTRACGAAEVSGTPEALVAPKAIGSFIGSGAQIQTQKYAFTCAYALCAILGLNQ